MADEEYEYLLDKSYRDKVSHFRFVLIKDSMVGVVRFHGKGTVPGTKAFVDLLEESLSVLPEGAKVKSIADLRDLHGTPIRSQFILGKWLFANKKHIDKVTIFGAAAWETKLAKAIFKIARMKNVHFFKNEDEATDCLGLPRGYAPEIPTQA